MIYALKTISVHIEKQQLCRKVYLNRIIHENYPNVMNTKAKKQIVALLCLAALPHQLYHAQVLEPVSRSINGRYIDDEEGKRAIPFVHIREADIMWARRVWHKIDFRQKLNQIYFYPLTPSNERINLISLIRLGIEQGKLTPYDPMYDDLRQVMRREEALQIGVYRDTVMIQDANPPYTERPVLIEEPFDPSRVKQIKLKEDWVFDKKRSVMEVRILAICPVIEVYDRNTGELRGLKDMFWINYQEARDFFASYKIYNPYNLAQRMSYDDAFCKRMFSSTIYKQDNTHDRMIQDYLAELDALYEAEDMKNKIMEYEHNLWEY